MKCPNCQSYNEAENRFCWNCGASLSPADEEQPPTTAPVTPTDSENQDTSEPTREGKKPLTRFVRSDFRKALLCTAVPIVVLSLISLAGAGTYMYEGLQLIWFGAAGLLVLAILAAIVLLITGRRQIAAGIFAGIGIGIVSLGVTCFANVNLARYG